MKTEVELDAAIGKTLQAVELSIYCSQAVLSFTDGTFSTMKADRGYDYGDEGIVEATLDLYSFGDDALIRAGIVTAEDLEAMRQQKIDKELSEAAARQDANDRRDFERLKRKFGA